MKAVIKTLLRRFGYDIIRYKPTKPEQLAGFLAATGICVVFDVGANVGQFARGLRAGGYNQKIYSFEPMAKQFGELKALCATDLQWQCYEFAFGDANQSQEINIADNSNAAASSFLKFSKFSERTVSVKTSSKTNVEIKTLDCFFEEQPPMQHDNMLLKLDVQGFEYNVLKGCQYNLFRFPAILLEASFFRLYENEKLAGKLIAYLSQKGYVPVAFYVEMQSDIGTTLQSDILFVSDELYQILEPLHG